MLLGANHHDNITSSDNSSPSEEDNPPAGHIEISNSSGNSLIGKTTNDTTPIIKGTAAAGDTVTILDNGKVIGTVTAGSDGSWSSTLPALADGSHSITTTVTDAAGNTSQPSAAIPVTVDTTAPAAAGDVELTDTAGDNLSGKASNDATPVLKGTAAAGDTVTILDNGKVIGTVTAGSDGSWSSTLPALADGSHSITTTVTDTAGNTSQSSAAIPVTIETTAPAAAGDISLTDSAGDERGGKTANDTTSILKGTAAAGDTVTILDNGKAIGTATAGSDGSWSSTLHALTDGSHSITTTVTDAAGNTSQPSAAITVTVGPATPAPAGDISLTDSAGDNLSGKTSNDATPILKGTAAAGDTVTILDNGKTIGTATAG
ncbi:Ig-like domain-containing protein, partial [Tatumella ptyseos]